MQLLDAALAFVITILVLSLALMVVIDHVVRKLRLRPQHLEAALRLLYEDFLTFRAVPLLPSRYEARPGEVRTRASAESQCFARVLLNYVGLRKDSLGALDRREGSLVEQGAQFLEFSPVHWITEERFAQAMRTDDLFAGKGLTLFERLSATSSRRQHWDEFVAYAIEHFPLRAANQGELFAWKAKRISYSLAFATAIVLNVNAFDIARTLLHDRPTRDRIIRELDPASVAAATSDSATSVVRDALTRIGDWGVPIGWQGSAIARAGAGVHDGRMSVADFAGNVVVWLAGVLVAGLLLGQGAPFWFEAVKAMLRVRNVAGVVSYTGPPAPVPANAAVAVALPDVMPHAVPGAVMARGLARVEDPPVDDQQTLASLLPGLVAAYRDQLLLLPNVTGVSTGFRSMARTNGARRPCVIVHVASAASGDALPALALLDGLVPRALPLVLPSGRTVQVPVDVAADGVIRTHGCGVGGRIANGMLVSSTGTAGCVVRDRMLPVDYLLTCYHVVANGHEWALFTPSADPSRDLVVWLDDAMPMTLGRISHAMRNRTADVALVEVEKPAEFSPALATFAASRSREVTWRDAMLETRVTMLGAKSGRRDGRIVNTGGTKVIRYDDGGDWPLDDLFGVAAEGSGGWTTISKHGDSGALIVERDTGAPLGIVVAGDESQTYVIPMTTIERQLDVAPRAAPA